MTKTLKFFLPSGLLPKLNYNLILRESDSDNGIACLNAVVEKDFIDEHISMLI